MMLSRDDRAFIQWLKETLIPDLRESGTDATADDFERCVKIMERLDVRRSARALCALKPDDYSSEAMEGFWIEVGDLLGNDAASPFELIAILKERLK